MFGGPALALAMFWFAWSANYNYVHWIVPTIAGVFIAASMLTIAVSFLNCELACLTSDPLLP